MKFLIVTPSYNQLSFLKRLIASIVEQATGAIRVHHHIQDGGSTDGTIDWLKRYAQEIGGQKSEVSGQRSEDHIPSAQCPVPSAYTFSFSSEKDEGMYDAINKGWLRASERLATSHQPFDESANFKLRTPNFDETILAHMNCDEQYLPGALQKIAAFFSNHPKADVVLADMIVVDNDGAYICHRRSLKPNALLSRICCVGMTTTTFQRAAVVRDRKVLFDTSWRNIGDMVWYNELHQSGVRFGVFNELVSLFVDTGENLNLTEEAIRERKRYADECLFGMRRISRLVSKFYSLRRYCKEFYLKPPTEYALYWNDLEKRDVRPIDKPTGLWHRSGPEDRHQRTED